MTSIRQDIEKALELRKHQKSKRIYVADGLRAKEVQSGSQVIYCSNCKGPVVDSDRARTIHAEKNERCRQAMERK